jgi:hypothetical protein
MALCCVTFISMRCSYTCCRESAAAAKLKARPVPTSTVTVVPGAAGYEIGTSWADPDPHKEQRTQLQTGTYQTLADVERALTISEGELREERLWLHAAHSRSLHSLASMEEEAHVKVTLRQYSGQGKSSVTVLRHYTGALGSGAAEEVAGTHSVLTLTECRHNPSAQPASFLSSAPTPKAVLQSILVELAVAVRHDHTVTALDIEVEVCRVTSELHRVIAELQQDLDGERSIELDCARYSTLNESELNLYGRCYRLRLHLQHSACVAVRSLALLDSCASLQVPHYELGRVQQALQILLAHCAAQRKDVKHAAGTGSMQVKLVPSALEVLFEVRLSLDNRPYGT